MKAAQMLTALPRAEIDQVPLQTPTRPLDASDVLTGMGPTCRTAKPGRSAMLARLVAHRVAAVCMRAVALAARFGVEAWAECKSGRAAPAWAVRWLAAVYRRVAKASVPYGLAAPAA